METPFDLLAYAVEVLESLAIPYAVGGSMAAMAYGEPRATTDVDVVVTMDAAQLSRLLARFPRPDYYVDPTAAAEALRTGGQFNVIHTDSGLKLDVYPAGDRLARLQVSRSRALETADGYTARFSPPEELIVKKLEYYSFGGSERQLRDIASMLRISGDAIDRARIAELAAGLGLSHIWQAILTRLGEA